MCTTILFCIGVLSVSVNSWDLSHYNISENYYTSSIAAYGNRAFLALPRSSCYNNKKHPTLVEVPWYNEQHKPIWSTTASIRTNKLLLWYDNYREKQISEQFILPRHNGGVRNNEVVLKPLFYLQSQNWNECDHLQDAISLDVEPLRGRLWTLDKGNSQCPSKLVIYSLIEKVNYTMDTPEVRKEHLYFLVVDTTRSLGTRGYIGLSDEEYILMFSFNEFKWWKINIQPSSELMPLQSTQYLAFDRKEPILYITGAESRGIFSLSLKTLTEELLEENSLSVNVSYVGEKLGNSSALVTDFRNGLSYYLIRDYAVMRWDMRHPSVAEHYSLLAQSYSILPYVSQLYTGPQNGIWALVNFGDPTKCSSEDLEHGPLKRRLVKLLKYNIQTYINNQ